MVGWLVGCLSSWRYQKWIAYQVWFLQARSAHLERNVLIQESTVSDESKNSIKSIENSRMKMLHEKGTWRENNNNKSMDKKWKDLFVYVLITGLANERKRQQKHISSSVTQWPQPVVIFLPCNPQIQSSHIFLACPA